MQKDQKVRLSSILCYKMLDEFGHLNIKDRFSDLKIAIKVEGRPSLYDAIKEAVSFLLKGNSHFIVSSEGHQFFVDSTKNNEANDNLSQGLRERNTAYCYDLSDDWISKQIDFHSSIDLSSDAYDVMNFMRNTDEGMAWFDCWNEGDFDSIFNEWQETPISLVFGCDSLVFCDI